MCGKRFFLSLFLVSVLSVCSAQDSNRRQSGPISKNAFWDQVRFGGGVSLGLNNG